MPIQGVRIGAFGWHGSHGGMVTAEGDNENVPLNRYCLSAEYDKDQYTFRAEYIHSQGWGTGVVGNNIINYDLGDKADGWYVFGIVPIIKSKLHAKARYQTYRVSKAWDSSVNQIECGLNYFFTKNLELHLEYSHVNDRNLVADKHNYNSVDMEFDFRF
jgi:predicted porin